MAGPQGRWAASPALPRARRGPYAAPRQLRPSIAIGTELVRGSVPKRVGTERNLSGRFIRRAWLLWMAPGSIPGNDPLALVVLVAAAGATVA